MLAAPLLLPPLGWVATTSFAGQPGDSLAEIQARGGGLNRVWSMPRSATDWRTTPGASCRRWTA